MLIHHEVHHVINDHRLNHWSLRECLPMCSLMRGYLHQHARNLADFEGIVWSFDTRTYATFASTSSAGLDVGVGMFRPRTSRSSSLKAKLRDTTKNRQRHRYFSLLVEID